MRWVKPATPPGCVNRNTTDDAKADIVAAGATASLLDERSDTWPKSAADKSVLATLRAERRGFLSMLVHTVYFWVKPELTAAQHADFRRGVESLTKIKGVEKGYVGTPAKTQKRPVIDDSYSVALTVLCKDVAAHDAYQADPVHLKFVEQFKTFWGRVQVYDAE